MKKASLVLLAVAAFNPVQSTYTQQQQNNNQLIVNGDFSQNDCRKDWCIFSQSKCVPGWIPQPQLEIGYGNIYNDCLQRQRVLQLAPNHNSCAKQILRNVQPGVYQLKFEWAARKGRSFNDCQFAVKFNGENIKTITPCDYQLHTETVEVKVKSSCESVELKFCGVGGDDNSYGSILKSVSLVKSSSYQVQYPQLPPVNRPPTYNPPVYNPPVFNPPVYPPVYNPPIYNPPVNPPSGLELDSHLGKCLQKQYQLQEGQHQIVFDYRIQAAVYIKESYLAVNLDGQIISKVFSSQSGNVVKVSFNVPKGLHLVSLCPVGCPTEISHKIILGNIIVNRKRCVGQWSNDLMVNGGFETNDCKADWCIWNENTCKAQSVPGWIPSPQIQVGKGSIYNKIWGNTWVSQLDPNRNSCIKQKVPLKPGKHVLNFDWSSRTGIKSSSDTFVVKLNGQVIKSIDPQDCELHQQKLEFSIDQCPAESWIQFCGTGDSDSFGSVIDNVKLFAYNECASYSVLQC